MNINQALQTVHLNHVLSCLGLKPDPKKSKDRDLWFASPFRNEADSSFHIDRVKNIWYDFGEGIGGNVISFACSYLESIGQSNTVSDALKWLANYSTEPSRSPNARSLVKENSKTLLLRRVEPIQNLALIQYLKSRSIDPDLVKTYVKEAYILNHKTKKEYFGLAFANEKGGYEFRNKYIKSSIGQKAITFIKGKRDTSRVHLFEGFIDFLTLMTLKKMRQPQDDVIILNSLSFLQQTKNFLIEKGYQDIHLWFDNDNAGSKAKAKLDQWTQNHHGLTIRDMNEVYAPYKDVNEWHTQTLKTQWVC
ncbi:MAG: toprim domain-containing protein [Reichenbachiella sp.]|uniref:toprim domain-containing protein n=1 Tax=Reichenbachiella sp. TaxID=2184521 RepID=UPI0032639C7D